MSTQMFHQATIYKLLTLLSARKFDIALYIAAIEKVSALMTEEYLAERAKHGSREKFETTLSKVADVEREEHDNL